MHASHKRAITYLEEVVYTQQMDPLNTLGNRYRLGYDFLQCIVH